MIVEGLQLKNFQCYAGEIADNTFKFSRGLNLVIGENGSGKSKLWDAFYWVLYDEIFQSDRREFLKTSIYKDQLISDKAKYECEVGESVDTLVILTARTSQGRIYRVTRAYKATKTEDNSFIGQDRSSVVIEEKKTSRWERLTPDKHDQIIETIIPSHLKKYMWFQGEHINQLMDLRDKTALSNVIELLSDIKTYNAIESIADNGSRDAAKAFQAAQRSSSKDVSRAQDLENSINVNRKLLAEQEKKLRLAIEERVTAEDARDDLLSQVDTAREQKSLAGQLKQLRTQTDFLADELDSKTEAISKNLITRSWVLMHCEESLQKFESKYSDFDRMCHDYQRNFDANLSPLPVDIPRPVDIRAMLNAEKCLVCGREAKAGTAEHNHIEALLGRMDNVAKDPFPNDSKSFLDRLYRTTLEYAAKRRDIRDDIGAEYEQISKLQEKIKQNNLAEKSLLNQLPSGIDEEELAGGQNVLNQFQTHDARAKNAERNEESANRSIANLKKLIEEESAELTGLSGADIPLEKIVAAEVWEKLSRLATEARHAVFQDIVTDLQSRANDIFRQMTSRTDSITGRLSLEVTASNTCMPKIVDSDGNALAGSNDSNIILVKLALIMAVLSSRQKWSENYALIADAPTSKMAGNYSDGFYAALSSNFEQSIVVTYDFLDPEDRKRLDGLTVGEVYHVWSSHGSEQRESRHDLKVISERVTL